MNPRLYSRGDLAQVLRSALEGRFRAIGVDDAHLRPSGESAAVTIDGVAIRRRREDFDVVVHFSLQGRRECVYEFVFPEAWRVALSEERGYAEERAGGPEEPTGVGQEAAEGIVTRMYTFFCEELVASDLGLPDCVPGRVMIIEYSW